MRSNLLMTTLLFIFLAVIASAQVSITVNVPTAGGLSAAFTAAGGDKTKVTNLTVTGNIDARDVKFMRDYLPKLAVLDLDSVQIKAYTGTGGTNVILQPANTVITYPENTMPAESFLNRDYNSTLKKLILPSSLKEIGDLAFRGCERLTGSLIIPDSVTTIGNDAFSSCNFTGDLLIPNSVTSIGTSAFSGFTGKLTLPANNCQLGDFAFEACGFTGTLIITDTYTKIGENTFRLCSGFTNLILSNNIDSLEYDVFQGCKGFKGELIIPGSVTTIVSAFRGCSGFTSCYIPSSVTSIYPSNIYQGWDWGAFKELKGLRKLAVDKDGPLKIDEYTFFGVNKITCELIVPKGSKAAYELAAGWSQFKNITEALFVKLNTQGGHPAAPVTTPLSNSPISEPANPIREGYFFAGWYKEADCNNLWDFATDTVSAPTTLYAKWIANPENTFTVSFMVDGGTGVTNVVTPINSTIAQPAAPTKADCTFGGWYKEADFKDAWNFTSDTVTCQTMLFAKWNVNMVTVSFNVDGGTAVANIEVPVKTMLTKPKNPTKMGNTFGGWYKGAECIDAWNFSTDVITTPVTLYAKWKAVNGIENQQLSICDLFPNPVSTSLYLSNLPLKAEIKILSADGKLIKDIEAISTETTIDVSSLNNGIYLLKVKSKEGISVEKFIKQ
jgi:uncharacterized repeat protein (TIGR02543 family)